MIKILFKIFFTFALLQTTLYAKEINIDKLVQNSNKSNKKVLLYLHRVGCAYCNSMEEFTLEDELVLEYMQSNYEIVHINVSYKDIFIYKGKKSGGHCLAKRIGYAFYPSSLFLDKNGDIAYPVVGYKNEYEFLVILQYFKEDYYKTMTLKEYKKKIGFTKNLDEEIQDTREHDR